MAPEDKGASSLPQTGPGGRTNTQQNLYGSTMNGSNRIRLLKAKKKPDASDNEQRARKVVGYVRVSTEEQATTGHGLELQERAIRSFCQSQGHELVEIVSDAGVSGAKRPEDREGFRRVLELATARVFSILLVWKFDRLARNL